MFMRAKPDSLNLPDEFIAVKIDCVYFIFLHVVDVSCFNLEDSIEPLLIRLRFYLRFNLRYEVLPHSEVVNTEMMTCHQYSS